MPRGALVTIEGIDGSGKTTLAESLAGAIAARGHTVELLREPGGVPVSERIRSMVKDADLKIGARAEALLYAAARAQLVEERVQPLLRAGAIVLLDRFVDSSLAYQGAGRELGLEPVREINAFATGGLKADRTLWLDIDPRMGTARARARAVQADRMEAQPERFFELIDGAYRELAAAEPERIRRIDASQPPDRVLLDALDAIADLLGRLAGP